MTSCKPAPAPDKAIFLDKDFNQAINDNAEAAWRQYCNANGLNTDGKKRSANPPEALAADSAP